MAFGNSSKSFGPKSVKKRKQDFHKHKIRLGEATEQNLDLAKLKERTMLSLVHLGLQRFSQAPGGYSFESWMKSFNMLLDDFEKSVGVQNLPKDYFEKRFEVTSTLANSRISDSSGLDNEIAKERAEFQRLSAQINDTEIRNKTRHELVERKSKIKSYEEERAKLGKESERIRLELAQRTKKVNDSSKILNRIFGVTAKPEDRAAVERLETQLRDLELRIELVAKKIEEQEERIRLMSPPSSYEENDVEGIPELRAKLESVSASLEELDAKKLEEMEVLDERIRATDRMREIISNLKVPADVW